MSCSRLAIRIGFACLGLALWPLAATLLYLALAAESEVM